MIASLKISTDEQNETEKIHLIRTKIVTMQPHHIFLVPLKAINQTINTKFPSEALLEIEENPVLTIEQTELVLATTLQKLRSQVPVGSTVQPKWSNFNAEMEHYPCYIKESDYMKKDLQNN